MAKITVSEDCGNSPKNKFVQQLSLALATCDPATLLESITGDIRWDIVGQASFHGKDGLASAIQSLASNPVAEVVIEHVLTHGRSGAVNGTASLKNGSTRAFCDVYEFSSAKGVRVKAITSYWVEIDRPGLPGQQA